MIEFSKFRGLEEALYHSLQNPAGSRELADMDINAIEWLSNLAVNEDWYGDVNLLRAATAYLWKTSDVKPFIAHSLWCASREAQWLLKINQPSATGLSYLFWHTEHLAATLNKPTIVVAPMTIGTHDAMHLILATLNELQPDRKVCFYGENMESFLDLHPEYRSFFVQDTLTGVKHILKTLQQGGMFFTYPDFVYQVHPMVKGKLFGTDRSFSSSFLKIALTSNADLLPLTVMRSGYELHLQFYAAISAKNDPAFKLLPYEHRVQLKCFLIGKILEGLILHVPNQWRLLPTLTHESLNMAI